MVDRKDPLPVTRQCALLDLPRSTFYHVPKPVSEEEKWAPKIGQREPVPSS